MKPRKPPIDVSARVVSRRREPKAAPPPAVSTEVAPPARGRVVGLSDDGAYEAGSRILAPLLGVRDPLGGALLGVAAVFVNASFRAPKPPRKVAPVPPTKRRARPRRKPKQLASG